MIFPKADSLKKTLKTYVIQSHKQIRFVKNEKVRIKAVYAVDETCTWSLYASLIQDIESYDQDFQWAQSEKCGTDFSTKYITSKWLCVMPLKKELTRMLYLVIFKYFLKWSKLISICISKFNWKLTKFKCFAM